MGKPEYPIKNLGEDITRLLWSYIEREPAPIIAIQRVGIEKRIDELKGQNIDTKENENYLSQILEEYWILRPDVEESYATAKEYTKNGK